MVIDIAKGAACSNKDAAPIHTLMVGLAWQMTWPLLFVPILPRRSREAEIIPLRQKQSAPASSKPDIARLRAMGYTVMSTGQYAKLLKQDAKPR